MVGNCGVGLYEKSRQASFEAGGEVTKRCFPGDVASREHWPDLAVFPGGEDSVNGAVVSQGLRAERQVMAPWVYLNTGDNTWPVSGSRRCQWRHGHRAEDGATAGHECAMRFGDTEGNPRRPVLAELIAGPAANRRRTTRKPPRVTGSVSLRRITSPVAWRAGSASSATARPRRCALYAAR